MIDNYVGVEILENLAYLANASNLVIYLSEYMHLSPSKSANNVTNFMGTSFLLALLGGFLADTFFTTYHVFLISAAIEFLVIAVCALSLSLFLSLLGGDGAVWNLFTCLINSLDGPGCLLLSLVALVFTGKQKHILHLRLMITSWL